MCEVDSLFVTSEWPTTQELGDGEVSSYRASEKWLHPRGGTASHDLWIVHVMVR
jgi:hypothetical protein